MSDLSRWWNLSVNEFFNQENWSGKLANSQQDYNLLVESLADSWQISSVKSFFESCPWSGQVAVVKPVNFLEPSACLTVSAREFFDLVPWQLGAETIPSATKVNIDKKPHQTPAKTQTIDDLAQLF